MGFWNSRTRRLLFVVVVMVVLTFPLVATLLTRARVERSGIDVTATVVEAARKGDGYLVAFRLPKEADPDQKTYSAEVEQAAYDNAVETKQITVRVLEDKPQAHRVEGEIVSKAPYVFAAVSASLVLAIGLLWVRAGRRRPSVRMRAEGPVEPAGEDDIDGLGRSPGADIYEAVGTVLSADDGEVVLDVGDRHVVVVLGGHANPVEVGSSARVRGLLIG